MIDIGLRKDWLKRMWRNGRRTRLKILRGRPRVGSSPTIRRQKKQLKPLENRGVWLFFFFRPGSHQLYDNAIVQQPYSNAEKRLNRLFLNRPEHLTFSSIFQYLPKHLLYISIPFDIRISADPLRFFHRFSHFWFKLPYILRIRHIKGYAFP